MIGAMLLYRRIMSERDRATLSRTLERAATRWSSYDPALDRFRAELRRAKAVPPERVPSDVITMNSRFVVRDHHTGKALDWTLVYPGLDEPRQGRLSVLSPAGMALLGARVGEEVCWLSPAGPEVAAVRELLYQPEAAGDHHL